VLIQNLLILFLALGALWFGANLITKAALHIARSLAMSEGFIGMTVLALGTSFPEITIAVTGAMQKLAGQHTSGIVVGNAIGASMNQLILIVAMTSLLRGGIKFNKGNILVDAAFVIVSITTFYVLSLDGQVSHAEGMIFVSLYVLYLLFVSRRNLLEQAAASIRRKLVNRRVKLVDMLQLVLGLFVIFQSSQLVLSKGVLIASQLGVSEATVGILLLGFGASLPEMVIAINAVLKGATALSLGNLVGGTVVNICLAMGLGAAIAGWEIDRALVQFDIPYLLFSAVVVILFIASRNKLSRREAMLLVALYLVYILLKTMGL
jgi:cation:H+ antiporter